MEYDEFEGEVIDKIEKISDVTRSDAQGIVLAQSFIMSQCWGLNKSVDDTANFINSASLCEKVIINPF